MERQLADAARRLVGRRSRTLTLSSEVRGVAGASRGAQSDRRATHASVVERILSAPRSPRSGPRSKLLPRPRSTRVKDRLRPSSGWRFKSGREDHGERDGQVVRSEPLGGGHPFGAGQNNIWTDIIDHNKREAKEKGDSGRPDAVLFVVGSKGSGKTTAVQRFLYPDKTDAPKPTEGMEYNYARKTHATNVERKDVAHIWEIAGSRQFADEVTEQENIFMVRARSGPRPFAIASGVPAFPSCESRASSPPRSSFTDPRTRLAASRRACAK